MRLPLFRTRIKTWAVIRARMMLETETFLDEGLRHPEKYPRIPSIPVGSGCFPRGLADVFWSQVLATS